MAWRISSIRSISGNRPVRPSGNIIDVYSANMTDREMNKPGPISALDASDMPQTENGIPRAAVSRILPVQAGKAKTWITGLAYSALAVIGMSVLGWLFQVPLLASFLPGQTPLAVTTAYALLLAAITLMFLVRAKKRLWPRVFAGTSLLIGLFSLLEPRLGLPFDPHAWLAAPFLDLSPGLSAHPTPHAAFGLVLVNLALLLSGGGGKWRLNAAQACATLALLGALLMFNAYMHGNPQLYMASPEFGTSPPAIFALLLLAIGALSLHPRHGFMASISSRQLGGLMLRRLLPFAALVPMLTSWLTHFGIEQGWYAWRLEGVVLSMLATLISFAALLAIGTVLNRKNEALARSNELLEKTFATPHVLTAYLDREFNFLRVNEAYAAADRHPPQYFVGKNHFALYPNAENEAIFQNVVATGKPYVAYAKPFEYTGAPGRGITYWDLSLYPIIAPQGEVEGLVLYLLDVTQRHLAEEQRLAAERKFHTLFNAANDAILIHPPSGNFIEVNDVACKRLGYSREELLKMGPAQIDHPDCAVNIPEVTRTLSEQGHVVFESVHLSRDGRAIPVEIGSHLMEFDGMTVVMSVARDISVRKATELALRESQEAARALIDATTESAILMDVNGTVRAINEVGAHRLDTTPQAMIGHNIYDLFPAPLAAQRRVMLAEVARTRQPLHGSDTRSGHHFEHNIYPILDDKGEVARVAIYSRDISEQKLLNAIDTLLEEIDQQILRGTNLDTLLQFSCDEIIRLFGFRFAWIGRKEADGMLAIAAAAGPAMGYRQHLEQIGIRWDDSPQGNGPAGSTVRSGIPQLFDVDDASFQPWRITAEQHGLKAILGLPLKLHGIIYGALVLYAESRDSFRTTGVMERFRSVAERLSIALEWAVEHERIRLLSAALASASNGIFITNAQGTIQWINSAFSRLTGYGEQEVLGRTPRFMKSGEHNQE
ncbi:MAG: PAS domain S-box protein, partial [Hydrogenophilaceae bacterium]